MASPRLIERRRTSKSLVSSTSDAENKRPVSIRDHTRSYEIILGKKFHLYIFKFDQKISKVYLVRF